MTWLKTPSHETNFNHFLILSQPIRILWGIFLEFVSYVWWFCSFRFEEIAFLFFVSIYSPARVLSLVCCRPWRAWDSSVTTRTLTPTKCLTETTASRAISLFLDVLRCVQPRSDRRQTPYVWAGSPLYLLEGVLGVSTGRRVL